MGVRQVKEEVWSEEPGAFSRDAGGALGVVHWGDFRVAGAEVVDDAEAVEGV